MSDLIERDKAIANMRKNHDVNLGTLPTGNRSYEDIWHCVAIAYDEGIEYAIKVLNGMPSAQPEPQWIPCSERLPDKSGLYLTWTKFPYEEEPSWLIINYDADCEAFGEWEEHYHPDTLGYLDSEFNEFENVFAWMPLPEPWRGEENG